MSSNAMTLSVSATTVAGISRAMMRLKIDGCCVTFAAVATLVHGDEDLADELAAVAYRFRVVGGE